MSDPSSNVRFTVRVPSRRSLEVHVNDQSQARSLPLLSIGGGLAAGSQLRGEPALVIDCAQCTARPVGCSDCVVSFLLADPAECGTDLDAAEVAALAVLADSGLVPPLRLMSDRAPAERPAP